MRWIGRSCVVWMVIASVGCGTQNAPVDAEVGRETLRAALESWKKGEPVHGLQKGASPIYVIDPEWESGAKLLDYELVGTGDAKDAHLFCLVQLKLRLANGKEARREVHFVVSTAPHRTVSRKLF